MSAATPNLRPALDALKKFVRAVASVPRRELDEKIAAYELKRRLPRARKKRTA